jgi:hypothetical protein
MVEGLIVFGSLAILSVVVWFVDKTKKAKDYYDGDY